MLLCDADFARIDAFDKSPPISAMLQGYSFAYPFIQQLSSIALPNSPYLFLSFRSYYISYIIPSILPLFILTIILQSLNLLL